MYPHREMQDSIKGTHLPVSGYRGATAMSVETRTSSSASKYIHVFSLSLLSAVMVQPLKSFKNAKFNNVLAPGEIS